MKTTRVLGLMATTMLTAAAAPALAQTAPASDSQLEEVIVTAQKRAENLQSVPISVQAIGEQRLNELNVSDFTDYVKFLSSVQFKRDAPGFTKIYMRGIASGENANHSGPLPSVGVYLDETPVTTITGPLEFHIYDVARVESLVGPQGTLYGASSQAGTIRIITNKPDTTGFAAGYDLEANHVTHGDLGYSAEGFVNQPIGDNIAVRLVGWAEHDAGFIDNVAGTRTFPTGPITIDNKNAVEDDYNEVDIYGARAALKIDLGEHWTVTPTIMAQRTEADGLFAYDPLVGDLKVTHFYPEQSDDKWAIAALAVEGQVANLDLVYSGSYLRRWIDTESDYSDYSFFYDTLYSYYLTDDAGNVINPSQYIQGKDYFTKQSHEIRVSTTIADRFKILGGLFYEKQTHNIQQRYRVDGLAGSLEVPGWPDTLWLTKQLRTDRDYAAFVDGTFEINDQIAITGGIRFFKVKNSLEGFFGFGPGYSSSTGVAACFSPTPIVRGGPCTNLDKEVKEDGHTYRLNGEYKIDPDKMVYVTYSTGYRPGGINRRGTLPPYKSDFLKNLEFGWKTTWADNTVRWNGAIYYDKWDNFQFSFLGQNGLTNIANANSAKSQGIETEINWLVNEGFTINGGASYTYAVLTKPYCNDILVDPTCSNVDAPKGQRLPLTPKWRGNITARYEWDTGNDMRAHVQGSVISSGRFWADLRTVERNILGKLPGYATIDLSAGVQKDNWRVEAFAKNLLDRLGQTGRYAECAIQVCGAQTYNYPIQPRTIGIRFGQSF